LKPTTASKSRPISEPISTPVSNLGLVQPTALFSKSKSAPKSSVDARRSPISNIDLVSKSGSETKPQRAQGPLTPAKKPKLQKPRLSNLLPDDFDELSMGSNDFLELSATSFQSKLFPAIQEPKSHFARLTNKVGGTPNRASTPRSVKRHVSFNAGGGIDSNYSLIETPSGSMRKCGESGFRCERDFCFKCE
jgi:hypothetical protein